MASKNIQQIIQKKLGKFPAALIFAFLEWVLIVLLFLDGLVSFIANEYARFFGLKIPCLLCTRIDHVLVSRDPELYYKDSICDAHGKGISSLGYCHTHKCLSDVQRMCADCLLSFATKSKSSSETHRSLAGMLGAKVEISVNDTSKIHLNFPVAKEEDRLEAEKSNTGRCSCCGGPLRSPVSTVCEGPEVPVQSTVPINREPSIATTNEESRNIYPLSHIGYMKLKLTSDAESENVNDDNCPVVLAPEYDTDIDEVKCKEAKRLSRRSSLGTGMNQDNNSNKEIEVIDLNDAYKIAMANKLNKNFGIAFADDPKVSRMHKPSGLPLLRKRSSSARDRSTVDSTKGSNANKVHWKNLLHRLKRQVHLDRRSLIAMSSELDQERSASAIAANEALAMITRLQEQKAAVQMEASHYHRLMEEQVEHDQGAMEMMGDLLISREKKIKALAAEVEIYRQKFQTEVEKCGETEVDYCEEMLWKDSKKIEADSINRS